MVLKAIELTLGSGVLAAPRLWLSAMHLLATTAPLSLSSPPSSLRTGCLWTQISYRHPGTNEVIDQQLPLLLCPVGMLENTRSTKGWLKYQHEGAAQSTSEEHTTEFASARRQPTHRTLPQKRKSIKPKGRVKYCLITQLRARCVRAHWVSLLADRNIDGVSYTCWRLTAQLSGLRKTSQPPPQPPLHSLAQDLQPPGR